MLGAGVLSEVGGGGGGGVSLLSVPKLSTAVVMRSLLSLCTPTSAN